MILELLKLLLLFSIGMFAIVKGADLFTDAAVWIAQKTGIPREIIGATIVSLATTLPEFSVSVYASSTGHAAMSLGNAVGSNIFNIGFILGLSLLIRSCPVNRNIHLRQSTFMLGAGILAFLLALDGTISRIDGLILVTLLIIYVMYIARYQRAARPQQSGQNTSPTPGVSFRRKWIKFMVGAAAVVAGSRVAVVAGINLAHLLGVPEIVIGLTLVAAGTSLPELVTSLTATFKGYQELSVGNIMGAGLLNISWVTAVSAMVRPIPIEFANLGLDFPFMLVMMALLVIFGLTKNRLARWEGVVFLLVYGMYLSLLFKGHLG